MNLILDTHAFLFFINGDNNLPASCRDLIIEPTNSVYISRASLWEIAIKHNIGKLKLKNGFSDILFQLRKNIFTVLEIDDASLIVLDKLLLHHRDPFDRIIIAQAMAFSKQNEKPIIITRDDNFGLYNVMIQWD